MFILTKRISFVFLSMVLFFLVNSAFAAPPDKHYTIDEIKITANLDADGSLFIEEHRTYSFRGSFSWADYKLPLKKLGKVTDFSLSEGNKTYDPMSGKNPGSYEIRQTKDEFYAKWYYRARNESRTFTLRYRVADAVNVYQDVAEFYYKFVGEDTESNIHNVDVTITLPQPANTSQVKAYAHGPLNGLLEFNDGKIRLWVSPLPKRTWWEARVMFPADWMLDSVPRQSTAMYDRIMSEEQVLVERSNAKRLAMKRKNEFREQHQENATQGSWILALAGLLAVFFLYNRFGKAHQVPVYGTISSEIPADITPAVANYVYTTGQPGAGAMVATMLDLARRGFLKIEEDVVDKRSIFGASQKKIYTLKLITRIFQAKKGELLPFELDMIQFLFFKLAGGKDVIQFEDIKKSKKEVLKWFNIWKKMIKEQWGKGGFYEKSSIRGMVYSIILSIIMIVIAIFVFIYFDTPGAIILVAGFVIFGLSFAILTFTKETKTIRMKLIALKKYLTRFHARQDVGNVQSNIEQYLGYAVTLGIGVSAIKKMLASIPEWQSGAHFAWYISSMGRGSPGDFAGAVTSMITATSTTMGTAAGASAGGGGGAGGASGGAG